LPSKGGKKDSTEAGHFGPQKKRKGAISSGEKLMKGTRNRGLAEENDYSPRGVGTKEVDITLETKREGARGVAATCRGGDRHFVLFSPKKEKGVHRKAVGHRS